MKDLAIIRVPLHYGQPKKGVEFGPDALLDKGLVGKLQSLGVSVATNSEVNIPEFSNDPTEVNLKNPRAVADSNKRISDKVQEEIKAGRQCLILGGDHSLGIGSVHGDAQAGLRPVLLWIDAHADINPPHVSPSGNAHGMPVAFVTEELKPYISKKLTDFCWLKHFISVRDIAYIGLRDIDTGERRIIEDYGIASFSMHEIERHGIANTLQMALCAIDPYGNRPIHVSFDIDSLDPSVTPSTGTPVPGGLTLREGLYLAEELAETGRVRVLDVVELNPKLGSKEDQELTIENTIKVISHFYGNRQRGVYPKNYSVPQP